MKSIVLALVLVGCAASQPAIHVPEVTLDGTRGDAVMYPRDLSAARYTVFVFFANSCPCFSVHEPRLRALVDKFGPQGVSFAIVDSEKGRTVAQDGAEAERRKLPAPIFIDSGARLANALGARYATYSVVVDSAGRVRYRGGIDSDKNHLRDDSTAFLSDALGDLLAGREPARAEGKTLGCALQTW
jgi:hypothetical protein